MHPAGGHALAGVLRTDTAAVVTATGAAATPRREPRAGRQAPLRPASACSTGTSGGRAGRLAPAKRLILESAPQRQSILHVWEAAEPDSPQPFTARGTTIGPSARRCGAPGRRLGPLPPAGSRETCRLLGPSDQTDLREDVKFTELVATIVSSLLEMRRLQRASRPSASFSHRRDELALRRGPAPVPRARDGGLSAVLRPGGVFTGVGAVRRRPA